MFLCLIFLIFMPFYFHTTSGYPLGKSWFILRRWVGLLVLSVVGVLAVLSPLSSYPQSPSSIPQVGLPIVPLRIKFYTIKAELAATDASRTIGMMGRTSMADNEGMLFVFPQEQSVCMWMKNTLIPLSVAFIDNKGKILNIAEMQAQKEDSHCAKGASLYALEMNRGWFDKKGVAPGDIVGGLESLR